MCRSYINTATAILLSGAAAGMSVNVGNFAGPQGLQITPINLGQNSMGVARTGGATSSAPSGIVYGGEWGGSGRTNNYPKRHHISVAQGKRNAAKHRNRLKARGQHRRAVR